MTDVSDPIISDELPISGRARCPLCEVEGRDVHPIKGAGGGSGPFCWKHAQEYWKKKRSEMPDWVAEMVRQECRRRSRRKTMRVLDTDYDESDLRGMHDSDEMASDVWETRGATDGGIGAAEIQMELADLIRDAGLTHKQIATLSLRMLGWTWPMIVTTGLWDSVGGAGTSYRHAVQKMRATAGQDPLADQ